MLADQDLQALREALIEARKCIASSVQMRGFGGRTLAIIDAALTQSAPQASPWEPKQDRAGDYKLQAAGSLRAKPEASGNAESAAERFRRFGADEESDPVERLRAFCSFAMSGQDWLDVEAFFDAIRATTATPAAREAESGDTARLNWLAMQDVTVRTPLRYGSRENFMATPEDGDGETFPSDIRVKIDACLAASQTRPQAKKPDAPTADEIWAKLMQLDAHSLAGVYAAGWKAALAAPSPRPSQAGPVQGEYTPTFPHAIPPDYKS